MLGAAAIPVAESWLPRPACIVDARLALGAHGLRALAALCRRVEVWLPQRVHELLRDPPRRLASSDGLVPRPYALAARELDLSQAAREVREALDRASRLPAEAEFAAWPLHHLGDRADECRIPPHADGGLRQRTEQLRRGLDLLARASRFDLPRGDEITACFRDAAALGAALSAWDGFVLTRLEPDGWGAPALCDYLDAWGLEVRAIAPEDEGGSGPEAPAAAALRPLAWAGLRLAAVHLVVPGAAVVGGEDPRLDDAAVAEIWRGATACWREV